MPKKNRKRERGEEREKCDGDDKKIDWHVIMEKQRRDEKRKGKTSKKTSAKIDRIKLTSNKQKRDGPSDALKE